MPSTEDRLVFTGLDRLRHDLMNPLNVIVGATGALMQTDLDEGQRSWLRMLDSSVQRLQTIIERIDAYRTAPGLDGRARLADLCSIAEARVAKPIVRGRLIDAIQRIVGTNRAARILLVDDSPELVALVRVYLEGTGWEIDVVETGEGAVARATTEPYDVVLMDIDLPGLDGATAAHAIRAADLARGASPTPMIAMTAFDPGPVSDDSTTAYDEVRIDDPEIAPLVPEFLAHRRAEIGAFRQWLTRGDLGSIQAAAHKMKGTGRGYGLTIVSRLGGDLEEAAHHQDRATIARLIDELDEYLQRVRIVDENRRHAD
jgi:CheY-like chemotaxis protein/HPt (histidine-containing phosphotransfer) domain-containing protein